MANPLFPDVGNQDSLDQVRITVGEIAQLLNWLFQGNIDTLNIRRLNADKLNAGTIDTNKITITASGSGGYYVIDGNGIVANNGTDDTLKFDLATGLLTIISALIQSTTGFPRVELNSANTLISAYQDANNHMDISPTVGGSPSINFWAGGSSTSTIINTAIVMTIFSQVQMLLTSAGKMRLSSSDSINIDPDLALQINGTNGVTDTVYVASTPGGPANVAVNFTKGIRTL